MEDTIILNGRYNNYLEWDIYIAFVTSALAIPKYGGFRPRFPHPYPKLDKKLPPCKEVPPPPKEW